MALKGEISSVPLALLLVAYNCLFLPLAAPVVVFGWRLVNVTLYGHNRYDPSGPPLLFLLAAVAAEAYALGGLASRKNARGLAVGLAVSLLFLPLTLAVFLFSLAIGNR